MNIKRLLNESMTMDMHCYVNGVFSLCLFNLFAIQNKHKRLKCLCGVCHRR